MVREEETLNLIQKSDLLGHEFGREPVNERGRFPGTVGAGLIEITPACPGLEVVLLFGVHHSILGLSDSEDCDELCNLTSGEHCEQKAVIHHRHQAHEGLIHGTLQHRHLKGVLVFLLGLTKRTHISGRGKTGYYERSTAYGLINCLVLNQASGSETGFVFRILIMV